MTVSSRLLSGRQDHNPRDSGMTLVEVLVSIGLLSILGSMLLTVSLLTIKVTDKLDAREAGQSQAELGATAAARMLRTTMLPERAGDRTCREPGPNNTLVECSPVAFTSATPASVQFYAAPPPSGAVASVSGCGTSPSRVTLAVVDVGRVAGRKEFVLKQTVEAHKENSGYYSFGGAGGCAPVTRVLARGLENPASTQPKASNALPVFQFYGQDGTVLTNPSAQRAEITSVEVLMAARGNDRDGRQATLLRVRLPNVDTNLGEINGQ